ncbi:hypothetical protein [Streptomyces sp. NBC_01092]|uniref:CurL C-terminal domain-containing protein n=1 Tax=Streptomyces sp. NBC_01092 TaxID=2903748 RepID=UPI0038637CF0
MWPLSAASTGALGEQSAALAAWLREHPDPRPVDVAWSLATTRNALPERAVLMGTDVKELLTRLDALAVSGRVPEGAGTRARARDGAGPVFVFPGQGTH